MAPRMDLHYQTDNFQQQLHELWTLIAKGRLAQQYAIDAWLTLLRIQLMVWKNNTPDHRLPDSMWMHFFTHVPAAAPMGRNIWDRLWARRAEFVPCPVGPRALLACLGRATPEQFPPLDILNLAFEMNAELADFLSDYEPRFSEDVRHPSTRLDHVVTLLATLLARAVATGLPLPLVARFVSAAFDAKEHSVKEIFLRVLASFRGAGDEPARFFLEETVADHLCASSRDPAFGCARLQGFFHDPRAAEHDGAVRRMHSRLAQNMATGALRLRLRGSRPGAHHCQDGYRSDLTALRLFVLHDLTRAAAQATPYPALLCHVIRAFVDGNGHGRVPPASPLEDLVALLLEMDRGYGQEHGPLPSETELEQIGSLLPRIVDVDLYVMRNLVDRVQAGRGAGGLPRVWLVLARAMAPRFQASQLKAEAGDFYSRLHVRCEAWLLRGQGLQSSLPLAALVDASLQPCPAAFALWREAPELARALECVHAAAASLGREEAARCCPNIEVLRESMAAALAEWKAGRLPRVTFAHLAPEFVGSLQESARAMGLDDDPGQVLQAQQEALVARDAELASLRGVLEWCRVHGVSCEREGVLNLINAVEGLLASPDATDLGIKELVGKVKRELAGLEVALPNSGKTTLDFIRHFHGHRSVIFERMVAKQRGEHAGGAVTLGMAAAWVQDCFVAFQSMLDGRIPRSISSVVLDLIRDLNTLDEVSKITSFEFPTRSGTNNPEVLAAQLTKVTKLLQLHAYADEIARTLTLHKVVREDDEDLRCLRAAAQIEMKKDIVLSDIEGQLGRLETIFSGLEHRHLRVFTVVGDSTHIVNFFRERRLHSAEGREVWQELTARLNNMRLQGQDFMVSLYNNVVIAYRYCEPFAKTDASLQEVIRAVRALPSEAELECVRAANQYIREVENLFVMATSSSSESAALLAQRLMDTGVLRLSLRQMVALPSAYCVSYRVQMVEPGAAGEEDLEISKDDFSEHKRQLAFCLDASDQADMLRGFRDRLALIDDLVERCLRLESSGHPNFQDRQIHIALRASGVELEQWRRALQHAELSWQALLREKREEDNRLLLLSNREVMTLTMLIARTDFRFGHTRSDAASGDAEVKEERSRCVAHYLQLIDAFTAQPDANAANPVQPLDVGHISGLLDVVREEHNLDFYYQVPPDEFLNGLVVPVNPDAFVNPEGSRFLPEATMRRLEADSDAVIGGLLDAVLSLLRLGLSHGRAHEERGESKSQMVHSVASNTPEEMTKYSFMLDLCGAGRPLSMMQILSCSPDTDTADVELFFARVEHFHRHIFIVADLSQLTRAPREAVFRHQKRLHSLPGHADVHYLYCDAPAVSSFPWIERGVGGAGRQRALPRSPQAPKVRAFVGGVGAGKTHAIKQILRDRKAGGRRVGTIALNDQVDRVDILSRLSAVKGQAAVFFNVSVHAQLRQVNDLLFELLVCGVLRDPRSGSVFSLATAAADWEWFIECPFGLDPALGLTVGNCFAKLLPSIALLVRPEVVDEKAAYEIGDMERRVCVFLHAYLTKDANNKRLIDRTHDGHSAEGLSFAESEAAVRDAGRCREIVREVLENHLPNTRQRNSKYHTRKCLLALKRRFQYFEQCALFRFNAGTVGRHLGSTIMEQMLREADNLRSAELGHDGFFPHLYLVYDTNHCPIPMWADDATLARAEYRALTRYCKGGIEQLREYSARAAADASEINEWEHLLGWAFSVNPQDVRRCLRAQRFVVDRHNCFKLLLFHERRQAGECVVLEGETGVGKTFVLEMYARLLNLHLEQRRESEHCTSMKAKFCPWIHKLLRDNEDLRPGDEWSGWESALQNEEASIDQLQRLWAETLERADGVRAEWGSELNKELVRMLIKWVDTPTIDGRTLYPLMRRWKQDVRANRPLPSYANTTDALGKALALAARPLFYRLLIHPGVGPERIQKFLAPAIQLSKELGDKCTVVIFFDEMNTSTCFGLFKELFIDHSLNGKALPDGLFFAAAINPHTGPALDQANHHADANMPVVNRRVYFVHQIPDVMQQLVWKVTPPTRAMLHQFLLRKIDMLDDASFLHSGDRCPTVSPEKRARLCEMILAAHDFFTAHYAASSVSNRDIKRVFTALHFFWQHPSPLVRPEEQFQAAVTMAIALVYYLRLPTCAAPDDLRGGHDGTSRSVFESRMDAIMEQAGGFSLGRGFRQFVEAELRAFVNHDNFDIWPGIAINQAMKENIFSMVVCFCTRIPLGIIGAPGSSKTLSFHILRSNLRGEFSTKEFCRRFPALDPFVYQCSEYTTSAEVKSTFERALRRERAYEESNADTRCMVFIDEAGLPSESKMELKVLHQFLDEAEVAFVAVSNMQFDDANRNRMLTVTRSIAATDDLITLATGCLGLGDAEGGAELSNLERGFVAGLCEGYQDVVKDARFRNQFHYRDLIYTCRCMHRKTPAGQRCQFTPERLLVALEENMNGLSRPDFRALVIIMFERINLHLSRSTGEQMRRPPETKYRSEITVLREALSGEAHGTDRTDASLRSRYKLVIDSSDDQSGVRLLFERGLLKPQATDDRGDGTHVLVMTEFEDDGSDLQCAALISKLTFWMEQGHTVLLINTSRIHGALYDVFNQQFRRLATGGGAEEKVYANVAIGAQTYPCACHPNFRCIVHVAEKDMDSLPAPFKSRFEKFLLSPEVWMRASLDQLRSEDQVLMRQVETQVKSFVTHVGPQHFYGLNENSIRSIIISRIRDSPGPDDKAAVGMTSMFTSADTGTEDRLVSLIRSCCAQVAQLLPPEVLVLKLKTLDPAFRCYLCHNYFGESEHFCVSNFSHILLQRMQASRGAGGEAGELCLKQVLFTRKTGAMLELKQNQENLFGGELRGKVRVADSFHTLDDFERVLADFAAHPSQQIIYLLVDSTKATHNHLTMLRQILDKTDTRVNRVDNAGPPKCFVLVLHFPTHHLKLAACHPASFLRRWQVHFFDMKHSTTPVHVRGFVAALARYWQDSRVVSRRRPDTPDDDVFSCLFDSKGQAADVLWFFASRLSLQLSAQATQPPQPNHSDHDDGQVLPLCSPDASLAQKVKALASATEGAVLRHLTAAYYRQQTEERVYQLLYSVAERVTKGGEPGAARGWYSGYMEAVAADFRDEFLRFVSHGLALLCSDFGLVSLHRRRSEGQVVAAMLDSLVLPRDAPSEADSQHYFVRVTLGFVPSFPMFATLYRAVEWAVGRTRPMHTADIEPGALVTEMTRRLYQHEGSLRLELANRALSEPSLRGVFRYYLSDLATEIVSRPGYVLDQDARLRVMQAVSERLQVQVMALLDEEPSLLSYVCHLHLIAHRDEPLVRLLCQPCIQHVFGLEPDGARRLCAVADSHVEVGRAKAALLAELFAILQSAMRGVVDADDASFEEKRERLLVAYDGLSSLSKADTRALHADDDRAMDAVTAVSCVLRMNALAGMQQVQQDICARILRAKAAGGGIPEFVASVGACAQASGLDASAELAAGFSRSMFLSSARRMRFDSRGVMAAMMDVVTDTSATAASAQTRQAILTFVILQALGHGDFARADAALERAIASADRAHPGFRVVANAFVPLALRSEASPASISDMLFTSLLTIVRGHDLATLRHECDAIGTAANLSRVQRIRRAAYKYKLISELGRQAADGSFLAQGGGDWAPYLGSLTAMLGQQRSSTSPWVQLFTATVVLYSGEGRLVEVLRMRRFTQHAGPWAGALLRQIEQSELQERQRQDMAANEALLNENTRRCPHCREAVFKIEGCDLMICGRDYHSSGPHRGGCGRNFRWSQAAPYEGAPMAMPQAPLVIVDQQVVQRVADYQPVSVDSLVDALRGDGAARFPLLRLWSQSQRMDVPRLRMLGPLAKMVDLLKTRLSQRYSASDLLFKTLSDARVRLAEGAETPSERLQINAILDEGLAEFNAFHDLVAGRMNPGPCQGRGEQDFPKIDDETKLHQLVPTDEDEGLVLKVLDKLVLIQNKLFDQARTFAGTLPPELEAIVEASSAPVSILDVIVLEGRVLEAGAPGEMEAMAVAFARENDDDQGGFDLGRMQALCAEWYLKGKCKIDQTELRRPYAVKTSQRMEAGALSVRSREEIERVLRGAQQDEIRRASCELDIIHDAALNAAATSDVSAVGLRSFVLSQDGLPCGVVLEVCGQVDGVQVQHVEVLKGMLWGAMQEGLHLCNHLPMELKRDMPHDMLRGVRAWIREHGMQELQAAQRLIEDDVDDLREATDRSLRTHVGAIHMEAGGMLNSVPEAVLGCHVGHTLAEILKYIAELQSQADANSDDSGGSLWREIGPDRAASHVSARTDAGEQGAGSWVSFGHQRRNEWEHDTPMDVADPAVTAPFQMEQEVRTLERVLAEDDDGYAYVEVPIEPLGDGGYDEDALMLDVQAEEEADVEMPDAATAEAGAAENRAAVNGGAASDAITTPPPAANLKRALHLDLTPVTNPVSTDTHSVGTATPVAAGDTLRLYRSILDRQSGLLEFWGERGEHGVTTDDFCLGLAERVGVRKGWEGWVGALPLLTSSVFQSEVDGLAVDYYAFLTSLQSEVINVARQTPRPTRGVTPVLASVASGPAKAALPLTGQISSSTQGTAPRVIPTQSDAGVTGTASQLDLPVRPLAIPGLQELGAPGSWVRLDEDDSEAGPESAAGHSFPGAEHAFPGVQRTSGNVYDPADSVVGIEVISVHPGLPGIQDELEPDGLLVSVVPQEVPLGSLVQQGTAVQSQPAQSLPVSSEVPIGTPVRQEVVRSQATGGAAVPDPAPVQPAAVQFPGVQPAQSLAAASPVVPWQPSSVQTPPAQPTPSAAQSHARAALLVQSSAGPSVAAAQLETSPLQSSPGPPAQPPVAPSGVVLQAKGVCPLCHETVWNTEPRALNPQGEYVHNRCLQGKQQPQAQGPEATGAASGLPTPSQAQAGVSPGLQLDSSASSGLTGTSPAGGAGSTVKGVCGVCGEQVLDFQDRARNQQGVYFHAKCVQPTVQIPILNLNAHNAGPQSALATGAVALPLPSPAQGAPQAAAVSSAGTGTKSEAGPRLQAPSELENAAPGRDGGRPGVAAPASGQVVVVSKGNCCYCSKVVLNTQQRGKNEGGHYFHVACDPNFNLNRPAPAPPSANGPAGGHVGGLEV